MPLLVRPVPPYDLSTSCSVFAGGDPAVRIFRQGVYSQVIRIGERPVLIRVRDVGGDGDSLLAVDVLSGEDGGDVPGRDVEAAVSRLLNLNDDLGVFYRAVRDDPVLFRLTAGLSGLKISSSETIFESLVTTIIEQQIATGVARRIESRLVRRFGEEIRVGGSTFYAYPRPEDLLTAKPEEFRRCGLSSRKGEYIVNIARQVCDGTLDPATLGKKEDSGEIIRELCRIRGIGRWTAEFVLLRGLHRLDTFPADDLGIRRAIGRFYCPGEGVCSPDKAREIARSWGEWKGLAAYYLLFADQQAKAGPGGREGLRAERLSLTVRRSHSSSRGR